MTSPSEPRTRSLYHAAPSPIAAVVIVAVAIATIFTTQTVCRVVHAVPLVIVAASFLAGAVVVVAFARGDLALVGVTMPRGRFVLAGALVGLAAWYVDLRLELVVNLPGDTSAIDQLVMGPPLAASLLTLTLFPALGEELVFRGVLARALARRLPVAAAIAISAIVFSAYHLVPAQMLGTLPLAALLGLLAIRSDSVVPGALAHAMNNGIVVLLGHGYGNRVVDWVAAHGTTALAIACATLMVAVVLAIGRRPNN